jgi:hypothetical protein
VAVIAVLLVRVCCLVNDEDPQNVRLMPDLIRAGGGDQRLLPRRKDRAFVSAISRAVPGSVAGVSETFKTAGPPPR